jgi:hypothetical protein
MDTVMPLCNIADKLGRRYSLSVQEKEQGFYVTLSDELSGRIAGTHQADVIDRKDLEMFIDTTLLPDLPVLFTDIYINVEYRGCGLSKTLMGQSLNMLNKSECIHLMGFTEEGMSIMRPQYLTIEKYTEAKLLNPPYYPDWALGLDGWLFAKYQ